VCWGLLSCERYFFSIRFVCHFLGVFGLARDMVGDFPEMNA